MNIRNVIARRYLFTRRSISLVNVLSALSITGVTLGTALLIIVLSVFNGFFILVKNLMLSYDPDIRITSAQAKDLDVDLQLLEELKSLPEVRFVSPYLEGKGLVSSPEGLDRIVVLKGIDAKSYFPLQSEGAISFGEADISVRKGKPGIVLGERLMDQLRLDLDDRIRVLSASAVHQLIMQPGIPRSFSFQVRGAVNLPAVFGGSMALIDLYAAQRIFGKEQKVSGYDIRLKNNAKALALAADLREKLGDQVQVSTWYDLQKTVYDIMELEKWGAYAILMVIVIVAVLNILGSLTMIVIQKTRDIGVLKSLGMSPRAIRSIFLRQGLIIGLVGTGGGGMLGLALAWIQKETGLVKLAGSQSFIIDAFPVYVESLDVALVITGTLLLCLLASVYPAKRASSIQAAAAVRYE